MSRPPFRELIEAQWMVGRFVCVGLDPEMSKIPQVHHWGTWMDTIVGFGEAIVRATTDYVCAFKPNIAFYEAHGVDGILALRRTIEFIHRHVPLVPVILDAKRGDIGNTNRGYVEMAFEHLGVDAITVSPYLGREALLPFLQRSGKGIFVLCRTSNPGAGEFQDILVATDWAPDGTMPLYQYVAMEVAKDWNENGNCGLVVGATCPDELRQVRQIVGNMPILIPGIGAQGGDVEKIVKAGKDSRGKGMIINSSRGIIYSDDPREEAKKLHNQITRALTGQGEFAIELGI